MYVDEQLDLTTMLQLGCSYCPLSGGRERVLSVGVGGKRGVEGYEVVFGWMQWIL